MNVLYQSIHHEHKMQKHGFTKILLRSMLRETRICIFFAATSKKDPKMGV